MKKFFLGLFVGVLLMVSVSVYADEIESYIGKVIEGQFPVIVDGNEVEKPGIVVDGTTYLPVRAAAELFGYDVSFVDSQVILKKIKYVSIIGEPVKIGDETMEEEIISPMGKPYIPSQITDEGINSHIQIMKSRLRILEASDQESAQEEVPTLRSEIQFWENILDQRAAE